MSFADKNHEMQAPLGGSEDYKIAHEVAPYYLTDAIECIDSLFMLETSPILRRNFQYDNDAACATLDTSLLIDDGCDATNIYISQGLRIVHAKFKPPRSDRNHYHARVSTYIETAEVPIVTDYYIEELSNGVVFGSVRQYAFDEHWEDAEELDGVVKPNSMCDMTIFDSIELLKIVAAHKLNIEQETQLGSLTKE